MNKFLLLLAIFSSLVFSADLTVTALDYKQQNPQRNKTIVLRGKKGTAFVATTNANGIARLSVANGDTYSIWCDGITGEFDCGFGNSWPVPNNAGSGSIEIYYDDDRFELKGISFATGGSNMLSGSEKVLLPAVKGLQKYDTVKVEISGHTDNVGGEEYNEKLSQARAETVRGYLISKGIAEERITAVGYGYRQPRADNKTEKGRAQNRRIEIVIVH
ncbi:MAG: OmpA family protein [Fibromonadaceae bacterium]|jgi:outer membrane protein OmpA-like peptidoglycan-associated protein|nr:OmpA family protein [Fibromonadaceae bacterium]